LTGVAPCLISPLVPSARGSSGEPGTAKTSRPCSAASRAVISEPEALGRFDDDDAKRKPGDQLVAAWKIPRSRLPAERHFGERAARGKDFVELVGVADRCDPGRRGARRRYRSRDLDDAPPRHTAGEAGDDDEARFAQIARDHLCDAGDRTLRKPATTTRAFSVRRRWPRTTSSGSASSIIWSRCG
jgi:hypothetical protein